MDKFITFKNKFQFQKNESEINIEEEEKEVIKEAEGENKEEIVVDIKENNEDTKEKNKGHKEDVDTKEKNIGDKEDEDTNEKNKEVKVDKENNKVDEKIIQLENMDNEQLKKDFSKIEKRQEIRSKKDELLIRIFRILNYDVDNIKDLSSITLQRDLLRGKEITKKILELVPELREVYNSSYLTCLHDNSIFKQKFPVINLVRQILKCNHLLMTPKVVSNGYDKASGKKLITRIFVIEKELF